MKIILRHFLLRAFPLLCLLATALPAGAAPPVLDGNDPGVQAAIAVQLRHTHDLMQVPEVVGTATGLTDDGQPAILVFAKKPVAKAMIGDRIEGIPVITQVTGEFTTMKAIGQEAAPSVAGGKVNPTARFPRPVPIGVSTGNEGECSAGTIGARVKQGNQVYALSNNHVYALENTAPKGSGVLQPGLYDTRCVFNANNLIGTLSDFEPIVFSDDASNTIDAAIALSSTDRLGNTTPSNGYGTPSSTTAPAALNQAVQKYGRTTALTKGTVTGINATVDITYSSGTARFVNQIIVTSGKPFIKAGDSGSLLVTDPGRNPVGLLFAGSGSGKFAIANPIGDVLQRFGVAIDGN